jgi:hypothetical protein
MALDSPGAGEADRPFLAELVNAIRRAIVLTLRP